MKLTFMYTEVVSRKKLSKRKPFGCPGASVFFNQATLQNSFIVINIHIWVQCWNFCPENFLSLPIPDTVESFHKC